MNDLQTILDQAKAAYDADVDRQLAQIAEEQRKQSERLFKEREEVKAWLCTIMPNAIVEYIDLSDYSHEAAARLVYNDYGTERRGTWLVLGLPDAFPVYFNVYRDGGDFSLVKEQYASGSCNYAVPEWASVKRDEEGVPYFSYSQRYSRQHERLEFAIGKALAFWAEHGERLTAELERERFMGPAPEEAKPAPEPKTNEERIADALERIADALHDMDGIGYLSR